MAKGSQFWGNASGKLGEQVLYRAGGEQRARTYVAKIKNPRSYAQMKNRLLMLNVVSAFRTLKPLLSESFPTKKANQSAFNAFVQANKQTTGFYIAKEDLESGACVPYGMTIAKGTLGVSLQPRLEELKSLTDPDFSPKYAWVVDGLIDFSGFEFEIDTPAGGREPYLFTPTAQQLADIMKERCNVQLPSQYQLTVVSGEYGADDGDLSQDMWQLGYAVNHLQSANSYTREYGMKQGIDRLAIQFRVVTAVEDNARGKIKYTFDKVVIGGTHLFPDDAVNCAIGIVLSFKENGKYNVSTSKMCVAPAKLDGENIPSPTADYVEGGFYFEQVMEAYGYKTEGVLASTISDKPTAVEEEDEELEGGV